MERELVAESGAVQPKILILNGPNANLFGSREPLYGGTTNEEILARLKQAAAEYGAEIEYVQSNHEGDLIDALQRARGNVIGVVINPAGYTFSGYALRDAISACGHRAVEVHMTNMFGREEFRSHSAVAPVCEGYVCGLGAYGYEAALRYLMETNPSK